MLNKIVGNEIALKSFKNGASLRDAYLLTSTSSDVLRNSIKDSLRYLQKANEVLPLVEDVEPNLIDDLKSINRYVKVLHDVLQTKLMSNDIQFL